MRIDATASHQVTTQHIQLTNSAGSTSDQASFAAILNAKAEQAFDAGGSVDHKDNNQNDFTSMTRQELFDWMNGQIRSGEMSIKESSPFLLMTIKISETTGEPIDMATDSTRINFLEKLQLGIEGAFSNNDQGLAGRLQMAIDFIHRAQ